ncbi:GGDEF domain-containing protein [Paraglaciecola aquimarina]|uniref:diguanylate cyclase n=1 Tax=Paraglaciecola algarum TaxID=3050085 RepID=A0ABS9DB75_9ALTE|nr:GGDEF domain-containing protein [Paraglaciecola sp. G1-23]MCF2949637.1 GGDEF domain-containing protein [Paraglaciecola sp. G1-23]
MKFINKLTTYFYKGVPDKDDLESTQRIVVANIFSILGGVITLLMGVTALLNHKPVLATVLLIQSCIYFYAHLIFRNNWFSVPYKYSANLLSISLITLMVYLIYTGGVNGTGPLWIYLVPPVILFFGGLYKGSRNLLLFILFISFQLFYPDPILLATEYSYEFKSRLLYSFISVSLLFAVYEAARQSSYKSVIKISKQFERQAMHDVLSGLLNRRGMMQNLELEYARSKRSQLNTSLVMCDIDYFKKVNDLYGHEKGDEIIKKVGQIFTGELRKQDSIARWGGEEYLFLLPTTTSAQAEILAEKLRQKIQNTTFQSKDRQFNITVSMGIHQFSPFDSIDDAVNSADAKLYQAKSEGRNRWIS